MRARVDVGKPPIKVTFDFEDVDEVQLMLNELEDALQNDNSGVTDKLIYALRAATSEIIGEI